MCRWVILGRVVTCWFTSCTHTHTYIYMYIEYMYIYLEYYISIYILNWIFTYVCICVCFVYWDDDIKINYVTFMCASDFFVCVLGEKVRCWRMKLVDTYWYFFCARCEPTMMVDVSPEVPFKAEVLTFSFAEMSVLWHLHRSNHVCCLKILKCTWTRLIAWYFSF